MARYTLKQIQLTSEERLELEEWQRSNTIQASLAKRGRIILMLSGGSGITAISRAVAMDRRHIYKWIKRFEASRVAGLWDKPRSGRPPFFLHESPSMP